MNRSTAPWLLAAILEFAAIAFLSWNVFAREDEPAKETVLVAPLPSATSAAEPAHAASTATPSERSEPPPPARESHSPASAAPVSLSGCLVHGAVRMLDGGRMPPWVSLQLRRRGETTAVATDRLQQQFDSFAFPAVPAGEYELEAAGSGVDPRRIDVTIAPDTADTFVDVVLEPSWIVRVLLKAPDGVPLHEWLTPARRTELAIPPMFEPVVIALWQPLPPSMPVTGLRSNPFSVARWSGWRASVPRSELQGLPARYAGTLEMPERRAAFVAVLARDIVLAETPLAIGQEEVELTVDLALLQQSLCTVRLSVVGADDTPDPTAKVAIGDLQSVHAPVPVDAEGRFEQQKVMPGRLSVSIRSDTKAMLAFDVVLAPGSSTDLGRLRLQPSREVLVRLDGPGADGRVSVTCCSLDAPPAPGLEPMEWRTEWNGGNGKLSLPEGRHRMLLRSETGSAVVVFDTRALGEEPLVVSLERSATLQVDASALDSPFHLRIAAADGGAMYDGWLRARTRFDRRMPRGRYTATIEQIGVPPRTETIDLTADGATLRL